jgi:hypothetical protein
LLVANTKEKKKGVREEDSTGLDELIEVLALEGREDLLDLSGVGGDTDRVEDFADVRSSGVLVPA